MSLDVVRDALSTDPSRVGFFSDLDGTLAEIVDDPDGKHVESITLSYTFYEIDLPEAQAALDTETSTDIN